MQPVHADSTHWGTGVVRLRVSSNGIPLASELPKRTNWSFGPTPAVIAVWHRDAEATAGPATVMGTFSGRRENTLGAAGTAAFTFPAPVVGRPFTADVSGAFVRTQTLIQVELEGTAADGNGDIVPVRVTGSGSWQPTQGDGINQRTTEAEIVLSFVMIFPGDTPPPPGPKAVSALDFEGTATLPSFPCPPPGPGELPCVAGFTGTLESSMGGDGGPGLWALQLVAPMTAQVSYTDLLQPGAPCLEGIATGSGTATAGQNDMVGFWTNRLGEEQLVKGAQIEFSFDWRRFGTTAVMSLRDLRVRLHTPGQGWVEVVSPGSSSGPAAAVFVPAMTDAHLHACQEGVPGPALDAAINGFGSIHGL